MNKRSVGKKGEALALTYLLENGFSPVDQNYYTRNGEIDLVVKKDDILYFVEVKYRRNIGYGSPREALTPTKITHFKRACAYYIFKTGYKGSYKMSFLGITAGVPHLKYDWLENIFG